jgi:hypothetical protein
VGGVVSLLVELGIENYNSFTADVEQFLVGCFEVMSFSVMEWVPDIVNPDPIIPLDHRIELALRVGFLQQNPIVFETIEEAVINFNLTKILFLNVES